MNGRLPKGNSSLQDSQEFDPVTVLRALTFKENDLQQVFPLKAPGRFLTQHQCSTTGDVFLKVWDLNAEEEKRCLSQKKLDKPTPREIMKHYLAEGPILSVTQDECLANPEFESIYRAAQFDNFYKEYKNSKDDNLRIFKVCSLGGKEFAFLATGRETKSSHCFFIYQWAEDALNGPQKVISPQIASLQGPSSICSPAKGVVCLAHDGAIDVLIKGNNGFAVAKRILFSGHIYASQACGYHIKDMQVISAQEVLCFVLCYQYGRCIADLLVKVNIKEDSFLSLELPVGRQKETWRLPASFPMCSSLFLLTREGVQNGSRVYRHCVLDTQEMQLRRLLIDQNVIVQATLPQGHLLVGRSCSFQVLEVGSIQAYFHFLDSNVNDALENLLLKPLKALVAGYLNREISVGAHFASFYQGKNLGRRVVPPPEKKLAEEETSILCKVM